MSHNGHMMVLCDVHRETDTGIRHSQFYVLQSEAVPGREAKDPYGMIWVVDAIADPRPKSVFAVEQETSEFLAGLMQHA